MVTENWLEFILWRGEELARRLVDGHRAGRRDPRRHYPHAATLALERVTRPAFSKFELYQAALSSL